MKKYKVFEISKAMSEYRIEADSKEKAEEIVLNGDSDPIDTYYYDTEFEIKEIK
jgi:hypothetical protein